MYKRQDKCFPVGLYGLSMYTIENYLTCLSGNANTKLIILRLSNPFGPFQDLQRGQGIINILFENHFFKRQTEIWGDGTAVRDYIYTSDVSKAIERAIDYSGKSKLFNIGSSTGRSINEVIASIEKALGDRLDIYKNLDRKNKISSNILDTSFAKRELAWEAEVDFNNGLLKTMAHYKKLSGSVSYA